MNNKSDNTGGVSANTKEALLKKASDMLGMDIGTLRKSLATGDLTAIKERMNESDRDKLTKMMNDKATMDKAKKMAANR